MRVIFLSLLTLLHFLSSASNAGKEEEFCEEFISYLRKPNNLLMDRNHNDISRKIIFFAECKPQEAYEHFKTLASTAFPEGDKNDKDEVNHILHYHAGTYLAESNATNFWEVREYILLNFYNPNRKLGEHDKKIAAAVILNVLAEHFEGFRGSKLLLKK